MKKTLTLKNQYRIQKLPNPISIREAASEIYVANKLNDPFIIKKTNHVDFSDKILDNVRFIKVNSIPALEKQLTLQIYVDQAVSDGVHNSSLLRLDPDAKLNLDEQDTIVLNFTSTLPIAIIELPTQS